MRVFNMFKLLLLVMLPTCFLSDDKVSGYVTAYLNNPLLKDVVIRKLEVLTNFDSRKVDSSELQQDIVGVLYDLVDAVVIDKCEIGGMKFTIFDSHPSTLQRRLQLYHDVYLKPVRKKYKALLTCLL